MRLILLSRLQKNIEKEVIKMKINYQGNRLDITKRCAIITAGANEIEFVSNFTAEAIKNKYATTRDYEEKRIVLYAQVDSKKDYEYLKEIYKRCKEVFTNAKNPENEFNKNNQKISIETKNAKCNESTKKVKTTITHSDNMFNFERNREDFLNVIIKYIPVPYEFDNTVTKTYCCLKSKNNYEALQIYINNVNDDGFKKIANETIGKLLTNDCFNHTYNTDDYIVSLGRFRKNYTWIFIKKNDKVKCPFMDNKYLDKNENDEKILKKLDFLERIDIINTVGFGLKIFSDLEASYDKKNKNFKCAKKDIGSLVNIINPVNMIFVGNDKYKMAISDETYLLPSVVTDWIHLNTISAFNDKIMLIDNCGVLDLDNGRFSGLVPEFKKILNEIEIKIIQEIEIEENEYYLVYDKKTVERAVKKLKK